MIKSYLLVVKQDDFSSNIASMLKKKLEGILIEDTCHPDLIISIGGDGTMLYAVHEYFHLVDDCFFIGVHTGTLGFYTDYQANELDVLVEDIKRGEYSVTNRSALEIDVNYNDGRMVYYALNEMRLENPHFTQVVNVYINDEYLETFRGNGLCISTPSGSTAYNKSLSGAVVHPDLKVMQMTEIAGIHHNAYRSLGSSILLGECDTITLKCDNFESVFIGVDQFSYDLNRFESVNVSLSKHVVKCIQYRPLSFITRIRRSFISE